MNILETLGSSAISPQREIIKIKASIHTETANLLVAGYARVSSDSADQLNSFSAQVRYYTGLIENHDGWDFVEVYADEGTTGVSTEKRDDFNRMIADCRKGKINRIITKSTSRFARNTLDAISTIRELKEIGVTVLFETEYIQNRLYLAEPLNIACFILIKYNILCFAVAGNQGLCRLSLVCRLNPLHDV